LFSPNEAENRSIERAMREAGALGSPGGAGAAQAARPPPSHPAGAEGTERTGGSGDAAADLPSPPPPVQRDAAMPPPSPDPVAMLSFSPLAGCAALRALPQRLGSVSRTLFWRALAPSHADSHVPGRASVRVSLRRPRSEVTSSAEEAPAAAYRDDGGGGVAGIRAEAADDIFAFGGGGNPAAVLDVYALPHGADAALPAFADEPVEDDDEDEDEEQGAAYLSALQAEAEAAAATPLPQLDNGRVDVSAIIHASARRMAAFAGPHAASQLPPSGAHATPMQLPHGGGGGTERGALVLPPPPPGARPGGTPSSAARITTPQPPRMSQFAPDELQHWGLPPPVCAVYREKGLRRMYSWQVDALATPGVDEGRSLVYCAPTSGGKSLVAEVLLLRSLLRAGRAAMVVLPFVSLCEEKAEHLGRVVAGLGRAVHKFYGTHGGRLPQGDLGVLVCTFEKANAVVTRLIEADRLHELGCVVVDELHMLAGAPRALLCCVRCAVHSRFARLLTECVCVCVCVLALRAQTMTAARCWSCC
jgi:hypothetical protein